MLDAPAIPHLPGQRASANLSLEALAALGRRAGQDPALMAQVDRAAEEFEAVFLSQMLAPAFEGLTSEGIFGGGPGEEIYRSLLVDEYGKSIAKSGGIGIADAVKQEILKLQEVER